MARNVQINARETDSFPADSFTKDASAPTVGGKKGKARKSWWRAGKDWTPTQKGVRIPRWLAGKIYAMSHETGKYQHDLYAEALERFVEAYEEDKGEPAQWAPQRGKPDDGSPWGVVSTRPLTGEGVQGSAFR